VLGDALDDDGRDTFADDIRFVSPDVKVPMVTMSTVGTGDGPAVALVISRW
jgi:hypothetical protein